MTDPSQVKYARTSKIVIDATRQLPGEGGKEVFPETNRNLLIEGAPGFLSTSKNCTATRSATGKESSALK